METIHMSGKNNLYPHLLPDDIQLWEDFLDICGAQYDDFQYDIYCGDGRDPGPHYEPHMRSMGINLSRRRIDVLARRKGELHVIEITRAIGFRAIGQAMVYPLLLAVDLQTRTPITPILLSREIETDINLALDALGLHYCIIPSSGTPYIPEMLKRPPRGSDARKSAP